MKGKGVLSNGGVSTGNKLMSGSTGGVRCYVWAPLTGVPYNLLFFVAVETNVGYTVIADFVLQSETTEQIREALQILSSWNPAWQPPYFMVDYSEAEIESIQTTFPACNIPL